MIIHIVITETHISRNSGEESNGKKIIKKKFNGETDEKWEE